MTTTYTIRTETTRQRVSLKKDGFADVTMHTVIDQDGVSWGGTTDLATAQEKRDHLQRCADQMDQEGDTE